MSKDTRTNRQVDVSGRRFYPLMMALFSIFVLYPFLVDVTVHDWLIHSLAAFVLLAAFFTLHRERGYVSVSVVLAAAYIGSAVLALTKPTTTFEALFIASELALFLFLSVAIFLDVVRAEVVHADTLFGVVCLYFMIGITYSNAYVLIELLLPGSFEITRETRNLTELHFELLYFSFSTITTTGYGDITALTRPARMLGMLQSVTGVFYLAVLVSRLVAKLTQREDLT